MARLPKSMKETAEETKFFEDEKAAQLAEPEVEEEQETAAEEPQVVEAESEAEPEEETTDDQTEESAEGKAPEGRRVPIGELYAEREKRKELQAKITQLEGTFSKVMERLNQNQQIQQQVAQQPQPAQEPEIPAYSEDPVAHLKAKIDQLERASGTYSQSLQQQTTQQQLAQAIASSEHTFRTQHSDYDAAVEFVKQKRLAELAVLPQSAHNPVGVFRDEILWTSANALNQGMNPAEVFYNYAKAVGWQKPLSGNGKQVPTAQVSASDKLATVAKAQQTSRSLPRGGSAPPAAFSLEDLMKMEDKEFDSHFEKLARKYMA